MYSGIAMITPGNIWVTSSPFMPAARPGNSKREKAYAAVVDSAMPITVVMAETMIELSSWRQKSRSPRSVAKLSNVTVVGNGLADSAKLSSGVSAIFTTQSTG